MSNPMTLACRWTWLAAFAACALTAGSLRAAETIPSYPTRYFNDYALTVKPETADGLNRKLEDLEKQSSNQILVVVYPKMQSDTDVAQYCDRIYHAWVASGGVGQKDKNNGAVLFVFVQDHKMWIQTGRGLEGALPDATCKDITADLIAPKFKTGDYDGGLTAGVDAMIAATKGEYKGNGVTDYQRQHPANAATGGGGGGFSVGTIFFFIILFFIVSSIFRRRGGGGAPCSAAVHPSSFREVLGVALAAVVGVPVGLAAGVVRRTAAASPAAGVTPAAVERAAIGNRAKDVF